MDLAREARQSRQSAKRQLKRIDGGYRASQAQFRQEVRPFWSKYGIKPRKLWYDLYNYQSDVYDPRYIPEELYWSRIYPALNRPSFRHAYTDKCFYSRLFPYLKQPRTILSCSNYNYFDENGWPISLSMAKHLLTAESRFVLKPSIYSGEGADIFFYDRSESPFMNWDELLATYKTDFIVQEVAEQHPTLAAIHEDSLNTIRIISFLFRGEVHISSAILRMGVGGSRLDNISAGGIACPIGPDGRLADQAMNRKSEWMTEHPGGTVFSDVQLPNYERILDAVRTAHQTIPHFRIIGWDFAIDTAGDPLFIEYNGAPGMNQISCGPLFGDLTEAVLDMIFLGTPEYSELAFGATENPVERQETEKAVG